MDHFWPSRPGVIPGLQDHSHSSAWCNTRPPGPLLPPSGELVSNNTLLGIPWNCAANPWTIAGPPPGIIPGLEDHLPEVLLDILPTPVALLGETRPLGFYLPRAFSEEPYSYQPVTKVCVRCTFKRLKDAVYSCVSFREQLYFPVLSREPYLCHTVTKVCVCARHS